MSAWTKFRDNMLRPGGMFMEGGWINDYLNPKKPNPADQAMPYLDEAQKQYEPYQKQGQEAYNQLNPEYSKMTQDPAAFLEQLMKGYAPSTAYQQKFGQMSQAAGNTAAAGGMRGSLSDIQNQAGIADTLMGDDMQQWLQNAMGIKGAGMSGLNNFYNKGFEATSDVANVLNSKGGLAFQGQREENSQENMMQMMMKMLPQILAMMAKTGA